MLSKLRTCTRGGTVKKKYGKKESEAKKLPKLTSQHAEI
jgi:hypothetical protein